jgi:hypothetical protein
MKYRFFFHYNKPLSKQLGKTMWSVHHRGKCHMVENIICEVPLESKTNKRQPYAVMQGFTKGLVGDTKTLIIK